MEKGIVAGALFLTSILSPAPTPSPKTSQPPQIEMSTYRVKAGDSMQTIAKKEYGSEDFWTNIWDDNEWIKDPNVIEKDWKVKIEAKKTDKPKLLSDKLKQVQENKNQLAYAQDIKVQIPTEQVNSSTNEAALSPTPQPSSQPRSTTSTPGSLTDEQINFLGSCESGMTTDRNSGNGFYGAFQFSAGTWNRMGTGYERADLAPIEVQKDAVQRLVARSSVFGQFPGCSAKMRSLGLL